jgi:hypothetical protein
MMRSWLKTVVLVIALFLGDTGTGWAQATTTKNLNEFGVLVPLLPLDLGWGGVVQTDLVFQAQGRTTSQNARASWWRRDDRGGLAVQFQDHLRRTTRHLFGEDMAENLEWSTGQSYALSEDLNRGLDLKAAKLAGFTVGAHGWTLGMGYIWGEKNPALFKRYDEGLAVGVGYATPDQRWAGQLSLVRGGVSLGLIDLGNDNRTSMMLGVTWTHPRTGMGVTGALQAEYNNDEQGRDRSPVLVTVGTRIRF